MPDNTNGHTNDTPTFGFGLKAAKAPMCSICGNPIDAQGTWLGGHNAAPVTNGRCCTKCNQTVVVPARLRALGGQR